MGFDLIGKQIGVYRIDSLLGAGGMGEVYRAHDTKLARDVAIKVLPSDLASDPERLSRFQREARVLASLNHPHIGAIHGFEESSGIAALVLELVEGPTLAERIEKGPVSIGDALRIARQIAEALDAAHEKGIIHRDLKPANIKLTADGQVKVLDFGLAKFAHSSNQSSAQATETLATRAGAIFGTPAYMSPEQARGLPVDKRTDIWAFGCVLYEMLARRAAFQGATISDTLVGVLEREPDWSALPPQTPPDLRRLLQRCLQKDPRRRLHDIADVRLDVDEMLEAPSATRDRNLPGATTSMPFRRYGPHLLWASVVGILAALLAVRSFDSGRSPGDPRVTTMSVAPPRGTTFPRGSGAPWPSISPDGRHLAFVAISREGHQRLWIRRVEAAAVRPIEGTEGAIRPFWSPDSRSLAYFANGTLSRVDVDTGSVRVLADAPYQGGLAGAWGEGTILWAGSPAGISGIPASGGQSRVYVPRGDGFNPHSPSFLPDGRRFLYSRRAQQPEASRVCVGSLDSSETTCILNADSPVRYATPGYLLLVRDGALVAHPFDVDRLQVSGEPLTVTHESIDVYPFYTPPPFSASSDGILAYFASENGGRLTWLDRAGNRNGTPLVAGTRAALSPDERFLIAERRDLQSANIDLWLIDLVKGVESRFTFDQSVDVWPTFSPDGEQVVYASGGGPAGGMFSLRLKRTNGIGVGEALGIQGNNPHWSSDGRFILYQASAPKTSFDLWAVPLAGDRKPFPVARTEHGEREGRFSPDARWVAYDSTESGRREIWVQPFPPNGSRWQVSTSGGVSPQWRRDGKELFYVAADGALMAVPIQAGATFEWGAPRALFQTTFVGGTYASYAVSRDGQRFLVSVPPGVEEAAPITVVVNWTAALPR